MNLNIARSRAAVTVFNREIYAFFGTNSFGKTINSIERYISPSNTWEIIDPINILEGFEVTCGAASQINEDIIIIFGGFIDSSHFKNVSNFNRKILSFNVKNNSFKVLQREIPVDYINSCCNQPIFCGGNLYSVGCFPQEIYPKLTRCLDTDYIIKINRNLIEIDAVLVTKN